MIKNDKQLGYSKKWAEKFEKANRKLREDKEKKLFDPDGWQLLQDSNNSLRESIVDEIEEYEALIAHNPKKPIVLQIESMDELSDLLIKARIAFKITQQELAALCDFTTEQIQLFEDKDYQNASYVDFLAVANALGVEIVDGKFIANLDDFFRQKLAHIRFQNHLDDEMKAAS
ncbi:MAG: helix-turn-helix transcriptional regulator [Richelia sp. SL_2_1]|nr:helix-turn-helix transcriptional regulator [Richelia sp. SM2_1_7]NJM20645.1 helix-turn-helix transcriptional regulator [Richelia sp. SM1_7_0]NJN12695.1 helix-turn-helix transcriptional regulator [Richelia sp. RM1_1_1]NJO27298.1 helix-turn-helix transcriptional regulator [Richelia sp. SL_2_1]